MRDSIDLRLLLPAALAWSLGAATLGLPPTARVIGAAGLGGLTSAAAIWVLRPGARRRAAHAAYRPGAGAAAVLLTILAAALVLAGSGLAGWRRQAGALGSLAADGASVELVGTVAGDPRPVGSPSRGQQTLLVRLAVSSVQGRGSRSAVQARVLAFAGPAWAGVRWGERVRARGRLAPARPGDDVVATVAIRGPPRVLAGASPVARGAERLRSGLRTASSGLPADARGLLPGLVDGDTSRLPADLDLAMRATGLTHLSAVSGTNTTLVCALALGLGRSVGLGRRTRLVAAAAVLTGFVVLARPDPPVLRAAVMGALGLLALGTSRRRAAMPALAATVVVLLVIDPWLARSYGFALSVLATAGLVLFGRSWTDRLARWLPHPVAAAVAVPLAAQTLCGPVLVLLSGQVSLVSLPANMVAEPCVLPATVLGLAAALAQPILPGLATALAWMGALPCLVVAGTARGLARVPGGQMPWPGGVVGCLALAALTAVTLIAGPTLLRWVRGPGGVQPRTTSVLLAGAVFVGAAFVPLPGAAHWPPPDWLLVACDVGQGDAIVLSTAAGHAVLVDAGPDPALVDRCLRRLGVHTLDLVILTHFHADHVDGLEGALRGRRTGGVLVTVVDDPVHQARAVRRLAADKGIAVRTAVDGERLDVGAVQAQVLWPGRVIHEESVPNNASIVLWVQTHGVRMLLLGDVEPPAARVVAARLRARAGGPAVDVLKVAHHGSAKQDPGLLAQSRARVALVSVGADNDYGHPAAGTLRSLAGSGAVSARTDLQGDLAVVGTAGALRLVVSGPHAATVRGRR